MKIILTVPLFVSLAVALNAAVTVNSGFDKDAFVSADQATNNYGGAGALSISGTAPTTGTNGVMDSFISVNTATMVSAFNSAFGAGNWVITGATFKFTQNPSPNNPIFNVGTGSFQVIWFANDTWTNGTGNPMNPTTNGITYAQESLFLDPATDQNLGTFNYTGATTTYCALALNNSFVTNLQAGGEVALFLTAADPQIGFVFFSSHYAGNTNSLPYLSVSAMAQPGISGIATNGANIVLSATNGVAGSTYYVLTSTNLAAPASEWTPILTNVLAGSGNFSMTLTNAAVVSGPSPQFFVLRTE